MHEILYSYSFICDSKICIKRDKCCCKLYDVELSLKEMHRIINLFPAISKFCRTLRTGRVCKNVFEEEDRRFIIDKKADGYCVFAFFDDFNNLKCGVHSAAVEMKLDPYNYKPLVCSIWPLSIYQENPNNLYITLDTSAPCLMKTGRKQKGVDAKFMAALRVLLGNDFEKLNPKLRNPSSQNAYFEFFGDAFPKKMRGI